MKVVKEVLGLGMVPPEHCRETTKTSPVKTSVFKPIMGQKLTCIQRHTTLQQEIPQNQKNKDPWQESTISFCRR